MAFINMSIAELRDITKRSIETLELWLRKMIDEVLIKAYGAEYWKYQHTNGDYLLNKGLREKVDQWYNGNNSGRFTRWIDASLIEHVAEIICNKILYKNHFFHYFEGFFPKNFSIDSSIQYLKFIFADFVEVRNRLSHSNPISVRQAERIVCYTNDIIDSFKEFYLKTNMQNNFNVPSIIKYSDSFGKEVYVNILLGVGGTKVLNLQDLVIRCGEKIRMSIEVDSSFSDEDYVIKWNINLFNDVGTEKELIIELNESHVSDSFYITVMIVSNKSWHRYGYYDDRLQISFSVLPPID